MQVTLAKRVMEEMDGCNSVLDLGCMLGEYTAILKDAKRIISVDAEPRYLMSKAFADDRAEKHCSDLVEFLDETNSDSVDGIMLIDVLEHLDKDQGFLALDLARSVARKAIIVFTPDGFMEQTPEDSFGKILAAKSYEEIRFPCEYQRHRSGWTIAEFEQRSYDAELMVLGEDKPAIFAVLRKT